MSVVPLLLSIFAFGVACILALWNWRLRRRLAEADCRAATPSAVPAEAGTSADLQAIEDALRFIAQKGWNLRGEDFLVSLVRYLGETLGVDYVIVDRLAEEPGIAETVAVFAKGVVEPNLRYALAGTPCANILTAGLCCYPSQVQQQFPDDALLVEMGVESYVGVPLWDSDNRVLGLIAIMDGQPLGPRRDRAEALLQIAATRTAAELERRLLREREERRHAERLVLERQIHEARKLESLGKLAGGIAHDFNNLLGTVMGFAEFISETLTPEHPARSYAGRILVTCQRGKGLVERILDFARRKAAVRSPVMLGDLVTEVQPLIKMAIPASVSLVCDIDSSVALVEADRDQLAQVIMNLCFNARDAMEGTVGTLRLGVRVAPRGDWMLQPWAGTQDLWTEPDGTACMVIGHYNADATHAVLTVRDTGTGMTAQELASAFEPFFTTKERGRATGLGLSLVHGTVIAHQGCILVRSHPDSGTELHVVLPVMDAVAVAQPVIPQGTGRTADFTPPAGSVLVVDDNRDFGEMLALRLERKGWRVAWFSDARQALEAFQAEPSAWSALITDQSMPYLRGNDLIQSVRAIRADLRCILCTGYDAGLDAAELAALEPVTVLPKPLAPDDLWAALADLPPSTA